MVSDTIKAQANNLNFFYGNIHALKNINMPILLNRVTALIGPSGCGKTTLLNCLSGLDAIDEGEIVIEGVPLGEMSDRERTDYRARRMGFVFQFYNLMPVLSAVENVELPLLVSGVPPKEARRKALDALDLVGLRDWAEHVPDELSGGQRQRVTIARALVNNPDLIFLDEPTRGVDVGAKAEIHRILRDLAQSGVGIIVISSELPELIGICDRVLVVREGRITGEIMGDEMTEDRIMYLASIGQDRQRAS